MARIRLPDSDLPDVVNALLLRPRLATATGALNDAVMASDLDWRLHELVRYRIAVINGCATCLSWRTPEGEQAGVDEALLAAVPDWRDSVAFTEAERVALDYTERFCTDSTSVDDDLIDRLGDHFEPGEIVELTLVIGKYLSQGRFMQVLGLDQDCAVPQLAAQPVTS
jgi:AhpD family alkylhydroperoxidase